MARISLLTVAEVCATIFFFTATCFLSAAAIGALSYHSLDMYNDLVASIGRCSCRRCDRNEKKRPKACIKPFNEFERGSHVAFVHLCMSVMHSQ